MGCAILVEVVAICLLQKMLLNVFMYIIMFHESCALFNFLVVAHSGRKVPDKQGRGLEKSRENLL